jgi:hypothetical protein
MARPRTNPAKHRKNVAVTLDPELLLQARALAAHRGRSLSQLLDELLRAWIERESPSIEEQRTALDEFIENHEKREALRDAKERQVKAI